MIETEKPSEPEKQKELNNRISSLKKAEGQVENYTTSHKCDWLSACDRLGLLDPDETEQYGVVRNKDGKLELLQEPKKELNSLELFFEDVTLAESYILRDIINIANLLKDPAYAGLEGDFERKSSELIHSRADREKMKFTSEEERNLVRSFKDILIGNKNNISLYSNKINSINFLS